MSAIDESDLRSRARQKLASKELPGADPARTWAGPGSGQPCAVCEAPITTGHTEFELQFGQEGESLRFHRECQAAWDAERRRR